MVKKKLKITTTDLIAFFVLLAGFLLIAMGIDGEVKGMMGVVIGFYFRGKMNSK